MWNRLKDNAAVLVALLAALALIHNSNNTLHHRLDDIRTDINQRFDEQGRSINQRFADQNRSINQRFDDQNRYIDQRFDAVNQRFEVQDRKFDALIEEVSELRKLTVGIVERISRNEGEIDVIRQQLQIADQPSP